MFETLGKYLQALVLVWIVQLLVVEYRNRIRGPAHPGTEPQSSAHPSTEMGSAQWV